MGDAGLALALFAGGDFRSAVLPLWRRHNVLSLRDGHVWPRAAGARAVGVVGQRALSAQRAERFLCHIPHRQRGLRAVRHALPRPALVDVQRQHDILSGCARESQPAGQHALDRSWDLLRRQVAVAAQLVAFAWTGVRLSLANRRPGQRTVLGRSFFSGRGDLALVAAMAATGRRRLRLRRPSRPKERSCRPPTSLSRRIPA
jgi:hypothetical protein